MIVAYIADLHGNAPALDAVLGDLPSVDSVVCCGDLVGYYPDAAEVIERVRALGVATVRGNHELMVCGRRKPPPDRAARYRTQWTRDTLSGDQMRWLAALPSTLEYVWDGLEVCVRHASPWDEETYLYPDSARLSSIPLERDHWLVLGHTHYPLLARCGEGWIANPGSVGQPRDWDPRAAYGVLDTMTGRWRQCRVSYNHRAYQRRLESMGWEPALIALLGRTRTGSGPAGTSHPDPPPTGP